MKEKAIKCYLDGLTANTRTGDIVTKPMDSITNWNVDGKIIISVDTGKPGGDRS